MTTDEIEVAAEALVNQWVGSEDPNSPDESLGRLVAAIVALCEQVREWEQERCATILTDYETACAKTCAELESYPEGSPQSNMYWRADGASDAIEHLVTAIRAGGERE